MAIIDSYSKEELEKIVKESNSIKDVGRKLGYSEGGNNSKTIKKKLEYYNISTEHFTFLSPTKRNEENIFIENSTASQAVLRRHYISGNYTPYVCSICGQEPIWQGKELTLTLDHINGNNKDDRLENLRWVCPNCDRQLDTFGSKNKRNYKYNNTNKEKPKNCCIDCGIEISINGKRCISCYAKSIRKVERPSKEELMQKLYELKGNFTQIGKIYNVRDNTIRKWCKAYNLPYHSNDYQKGVIHESNVALRPDKVVYR